MSEDNPGRRVLVVGYPRAGKTLILREAVARIAKIAPQSFGYDNIAIAQPMPSAPEIEEPIPDAMMGMSARNARRLAKKKK